MRKRADAVPIEIHAGDNSTGIEFKTQMERLYTVRFRIVTADGSPIPVYSLGIAVDSPNQDGLAYHLTQNGNENGIFYAGYVPACYCTVQTYIKPVVGPEKVPPELTKWRMAKQEIIIPSKDDVIVITLNPAN